MTEPAQKRAKNVGTVVIGMFGGGVVGGGVVEILKREVAKLENRGVEVTIKKICVRDATKKRDYELPTGCSYVTNYDDILDDAEIDTVLELMGGTTSAKDVVFKAIEKGKNVITANKALIAGHMSELEALLAAHPQVKFLYEAAVGGGIPIIDTMQTTLAADSISRMCGIMNGTTNFMLSKMFLEGADYGAVLKEAQDLGFAEADPTADVEGHDVRAKIAILCKLAFGTQVSLEDIACKGISKLTSDDFAYAKDSLNSTINNLGMAMKNDDGSLSVFVSPVVVPLTNVIGGVNGATNIVSITSANMVESSLVGQGAGRFPTANSVVQDIVLLAKGISHSPFPSVPKGEEMVISKDYSAKFYVRLHITDGTGIIKSVGQICEDHEISINCILQTTILDRTDVKFVVCTESCKESAVAAMVKDFENFPFCKSAPMYMPMLS
jgi:homoserine dehydrogenase